MAKQQIGNIDINRGAKGDMPSFTINSTTVTDGSVITVSGEGGTSNPKVFIPTLATDFTSPNVANANKIWEVQSTIDLAGGNFTVPVNVTLSFKGGSILNVGTLVGNNTAFQFVNDNLGIDLFSATVSGTFTGKVFKASNFGAIDDNLETTDNYQVGYNLLYLTNQNSGHLIWNKRDTGKFWASVVYPSDYDSSFFPTSNDRTWIIGKGYDNVIVELAGTEIIQITDNYVRSHRFIFYNTRNSEIRGGILRGERHRHWYDQTLFITSGATSAGNVRLKIEETHPFRSTEVLKTIDELIPLTLSNAATNTQEIVDFINTNPSFADYTATNLGFVSGQYKFSLRGPAGNDFRTGGYFTDVSSGAVVGDEFTTHEGGHGIAFGSNAFFCKINNIHITEFHGDGISHVGQGNGTTHINFSNLTNGNITNDGVLNTDTNYYYLTTQRALPNSHPWFSFAPNAQSSTKIKQFRYWMVYYDEAGNFIEKSPKLIPYAKYTTMPEWKNYRIIVDNAGVTDMADFYFFINSRSYAQGSIMENIEISYCRRQGISDPSENFTIRNSKIHDTGGTEPQFGIDLEDTHKHGRGFLIDNVEFWNNANGDIIIKGLQNGNIQNCFFQQNSRNVKGGENEVALAVDTGYGRFITLSNNNFEYKKVALDLGAKFENNQMFYGNIISRAGGAIIQNNYLVNTLVHGGIRDGAVDSQGIGKNALCYLKGNTRVWSDMWDLKFDDDGNQYVKEDERILFNEETNMHWVTTDTTLQDVRPNTTSTGYMRADRILADVPEAKGFINKMEILGLLPNEPMRTQMSYPIYVSNVNELNVEFPLEINYGFPRDVTVKNSKAYMLSLTLGQFATDGVGTFQTITFKDDAFQVPARIDATHGWLDNSGYGTNYWYHEKFIRSNIDKNVNLYFKNTEFINNDGGTGHFMFLGHRGTTVFEGCTFKNAVSDTINFTLTSVDEETANTYTATNTGAITIIDPIVENITFTLRSIDKIVFTKASPLMATYATFADDAAAATAGYPSGYMYMTATGEFRIKL